MTSIRVKLPVRLRERVEQEARRHGLVPSAYVRMALEKVLAEAPEVSMVTCYDLMRDAAGMAKDAPPDLSCNKAHLNGLGR